MGTTYAQKYDQVFRALKTNLSVITKANGYETEVGLVHQRGEQIRPKDTGKAIIKITDKNEQHAYRPTREALTTFNYDIEGFLFQPDADKLRAALHRFVEDVVEAHFDDVYLAVADLANGGTGDKLVTEHRLDQTVRQYGAPNGYFRMEAHGTFFWRAGVPG